MATDSKRLNDLLDIQAKYISEGGINKLENLHGVPIVYMDCNADAFENLDQVAVKFTDNQWSEPKVIGFKTNPKDCPRDELVFVRLGESAFLWDMGTDTYHEDFPGPNATTAIESFLSGKVETTIGMPYELLLWNLYKTPSFEPPSNYSFITKNLEGLGTGPGEITSGTIDSISVVEIPFVSKTTTQTNSATDTPWGELRTDEIIESYATWQPPLGIYQTINISGFYMGMSTDIDYMDSAYTCPIDAKPAYAEYGYPIVDNEFGNDPIAMGYPGVRYSEKTMVQVIFSCAATSEWEYSVGTTPIGIRETTAQSCCDIYPFSARDASGETSDPYLQPKNDLFSEAVEDLIEYLHAIRGYTSDPGQIILAAGIIESCAAGPSWRHITDPLLEVKIYQR